MTIVLASTSPRRSELLKRAGIAFEVVPSPAEEIHDASIPCEVLCERNAELKAAAVALSRPDAVVIGADTLVFIDDQPLGKPGDMIEARAMLRRLSGRTHRVCTGVCVIPPNGRPMVFHANTDVTFRELDEERVEAYLAAVNPLDKAGGYGIQEHGDWIIESIDGAFDNVMGLPVQAVVDALAQIERSGA